MRNLFFSLIAFSAIPGIVQADTEVSQGSKNIDETPHQAPMAPTNSAYVAPAGINIGKPGDIDFFIMSSFLYWQFQQDNLVVGLVQDSSSVTSVPNSYLSNHFIEINPGFTPGFQVGLGMNLQRDNWEGLANYTRVHGSYSVSSNGSDPEGITIYVTDRLQAIFPPEMGAAISSTSSTVTPAYTSLSSTYRNHLDFIDGEMARTYYVGKALTLRTAMGLRSAWILQSLNSSYEVTVDPATARELFVESQAHSWGFGPRFGALLDWGVGKGFSLLGSVYGDILYTWYRIQDKTAVNFFNPEYAADRAGVDSNTFTTTDHPRALRSHIDMEMGVHWGTYLGNKNYHIDFSATYGFQVFFDQNMFRHWDGLLPAWSTLPHGNLYVNGLTFNARFDF
jgi:hypothetical protein